MASTEIHGGQVVYDLLGPPDGQPIVLTPGGRFSKDVPGLRPLAEALAQGGLRVLLWDRPNCGASDVQFHGRSESHMRADTLAELLTRLDLAPAVIAGGSGGARDSLLTVMRHPEVASRAIAWSIVGGVFSTLNLAGVYVLPNINTARILGMEGVAALPEWQALIEANPRNSERLLAMEPDEFVTVMLDHPKRTSMEVHCLIKDSILVEPPWPEDAWEQAVRASARGTGNIFDPWVRAAPLILDFACK